MFNQYFFTFYHVFIFLLYKVQCCSPGAGLQVVDCKRWDWVCHRSLEARIFSAENIFKSLFQFRGSNTSCSQRIFVSLHILYITLVVIFKKIKKLLLFDFKMIFKKSKSTFYYLFKNPQNTLYFPLKIKKHPLFQFWKLWNTIDSTYLVF